MFDVNYYSPDGKVGDWQHEDFSAPLVGDIDSVDGSDTMSLASSALIPMGIEQQMANNLVRLWDSE